VKLLAIAAVLVALAHKDCEAQGPGAALVVGIQTPAAPTDTAFVHNLKPKDTFLGPDKVKHFFMSAFVESVGFAGMEAVGGSRGTSIGTATAVSAAAGIGREVHDKITKNLFSLGDLLWDGLGIAAALLLISHT
jgi:hypothetical protein